jgi:hypothetical protein
MAQGTIQCLLSQTTYMFPSFPFLRVMKNLKTFVFATLLVTVFAGFAQAQSLNSLMKTFETSVQFDSQSDSWRDRRAGWLSEVNSASIEGLKRLMIELEENIKYESQTDSWRDSRSGWVSRVRSCTSRTTLAQLLIELETSVKFESQSESWRDERDSWLSSCRAIR